MVRELILISTLLAFPFSCNANSKPSFEEDPEISAKMIFDGFSGASLVVGTKKACGHIKSNLDLATPGEISLLLSTEDFSVLYDKKCKGKCDMVEINNIIADCKNKNQGKQCMWYAAILDSRVYTLSFDPTIQNIEKACFDGGN